MLDALLNLQYDKRLLRLVLVDNNSRDDTQKIIEGFASQYSNKYESITVRKCRPHIPTARNICLECAEGSDFVFFLDSDVVPPPDILQRLLSHFDHYVDLGIASVPCDHENARERAKFLYGAFITPTGPARAYRIGAGCTLTAMSVIKRTGPFNRNLRVHEDAEYCYRVTSLGYKIICDHSSRAFHLRRIRATPGYYLSFIVNSADTHIQFLKLRSPMHIAKYVSSLLLTFSILMLAFTRLPYFAVLFVVALAFAFWANLSRKVLDDGISVKLSYWPVVGAVLTVFVVAVVWTSIGKLLKMTFVSLVGADRDNRALRINA